MRLLIVTGIYPPDIGGPATHAADLRDELSETGNDVTVLTLWDGATVVERDGVVRFPRRQPVLVRMAGVTAWIARRGAGIDAVYATGLHTEAVLGARIAGVPVVVKIVGDPVWERGRRLGLTHTDFDAFQAAGRPNDLRLRALSWLRDRTLRSSTAVLTPSRYLADLVESWLGGPADVRVILNGVRVPAIGPALGSRDAALRVVYVGRLVAHKRVDRLISALTDGMRLDIVGSGPAEHELRGAAVPHGASVEFRGDLPHAEALAAIASADCLALASDYEGLPHVVIEALAAGTPVVAPPVGGVPEVVTDGVNGILLPDAEVASLSTAFSALRDDGSLRLRLREGARVSGASWLMDRTAASVVSLVTDVERPRPRAVFVGKTRVPRALDEDARGRFEILVRSTRPVVIGVGPAGARWFGRTKFIAFPDVAPRAVSSAVFYALAPLAGVALALGRRRAVVVCQSPFEGLGAVVFASIVPRSVRPAVIVEVHGDWRTATRLYGSPARRVLSPVADAAATWAVRGADSVRVVGEYTEGLVRETGYAGPIDSYTAFGGLDDFLAAPLVPAPDEPNAVFVGVLEPYKSVDVLLEAWRTVATTIPGARLAIVGEGSQAAALRRQAELAGLTSSVRFLGKLPRDRVIEELDRSRVLVLPSRSEGMGRVILEAFARGRPVVASEVGGIPGLVRDPELGLLVPPEDPDALAKAIVGMLTADPALLAMMGASARSSVESRPAELAFAAGIERLAGWAR